MQFKRQLQPEVINCATLGSVAEDQSHDTACEDRLNDIALFCNGSSFYRYFYFFLAILEQRFHVHDQNQVEVGLIVMQS